MEASVVQREVIRLTEASDLTSSTIVLRRIRRRPRETVAWVLNTHEMLFIVMRSRGDAAAINASM
jgi:hypothetical protein